MVAYGFAFSVCAIFCVCIFIRLLACNDQDCCGIEAQTYCEEGYLRIYSDADCDCGYTGAKLQEYVWFAHCTCVHALVGITFCWFRHLNGIALFGGLTYSGQWKSTR